MSAIAKLLSQSAVFLCLALPVATAGEPAASAAQASQALTLTQGSRLMIDARINGHAVQALLDSAAEATILDRRFAQTLKLGSGQAATGQGSGQGSFEAALVDGVTIEALGLSLPNQTVAVADLDDVGRRLLKRRLEVILGRELFDAARLSVDIEARRISVAGRGQEPAGVRLALATEHGVETIPVQVEEGAPVRATFDLGNGSHVLLSRSYAQRLGLGTDGRAVRTERGGGLGGETARQVYTLRAITIAGRKFTNVPAAIDPQPSASDVNVGISLLRHFRITTDYASHAVWLEARERKVSP
jgi:predicted aspartyl protease